ncbi:DUF2306 domain-containing protein [Tumebacillus lipolyticus]|uniref:DUF2306 domain-containing protein n=1 Tax=Tumebacillus lipolyticus TaxID=1280370 RepID=A0ABW5A3H1_9BACL
MRSKWLLFAIFLFLLYTFTVNFILDPEATQFLAHKDKLPKNSDAWLLVMRIHTIFASIALLTGALNFLTPHRKRLHRSLGLLYCIAVLGTVVTSGYMAPTATGGKVTSMVFNLLELAWLASTFMAVLHILRKNLRKHRNWMIRSFVICFTNFFVHLIAYLLHAIFDLDYRDAYVFGVYGSIVINLSLAEYWIWRSARR